jgi:hypothetical protein
MLLAAHELISRTKGKLEFLLFFCVVSGWVGVRDREREREREREKERELELERERKKKERERMM